MIAAIKIAADMKDSRASALAILKDILDGGNATKAKSTSSKQRATEAIV